MAPKAKFTRAQLQEAALGLVDEQGLAALSMRTLAGEDGVSRFPWKSLMPMICTSTGATGTGTGLGWVVQPARNSAAATAIFFNISVRVLPEVGGVRRTTH